MPMTRSQIRSQEHTMEPPSPPYHSPSPIVIDVTTDIPNTIHEEEEVLDWQEPGVIYWEYNDTQYLKDSEGFLYDTITGENVGYFDGERVMDMVEDGVWVEQSIKTEIVPKHEIDKNNSEEDLLKIRVKQLEKELINKDREMSLKTVELKNRDRDILNHENIRQELIQRVNDWISKYDKIHSKYSDLEDELTAFESIADTTTAVLQESGAFDSEKMTDEQLKLEITRKEQVIIRKDAKATRLINIIREKNIEIGTLKTSLTSYQNYSWMLNTNVSNLSDKVIQWQNYYNQMTTTTSYPEPDINIKTYLGESNDYNC